MFVQVAFLAKDLLAVLYLALKWFLTGMDSQVIKKVVNLVEGLPLA